MFKSKTKKSSEKWYDDKKGGFSGKKNFGGGGWKGGGDRGPRSSMHKATCGECNSSCEVPFKPNGRKPVLCSNCFEKESGGARKSKFGGAKRFGGSNRDGKPAFRTAPSDGNKEVVKQLKELNTKMDKVLIAMTDLIDGMNGNVEIDED